jgi:putative ABC transport system permease protein
MTEPRTLNRAMFWRILRRLLGANRGRLFVMLLALGAGAAVTAALLNLQIDAKRRITTEFRAFGANVLVIPKGSSVSLSESRTMPSAVLGRIPAQNGPNPVPKVALLYAIAQAKAYDEKEKEIAPGRVVPVVVSGFRYWGDDLAQLIPFKTTQRFDGVFLDIDTCEIGERVASELRVPISGELLLEGPQHNGDCKVSEIRSYGGPEDSQVFLPIDTVQDMTAHQGQVSAVLLAVPGSPESIDHYIFELQKRLPEADVRPVRQFTEGEAKIYNRISGLLTATVGIVLLLTALCVMAAMTNVAMERKMDVGLMKAIGGATRRVVRLFLAEAALLGLAGGLIGAAAGIFLSIGLGKAVFGVAARPRLIVYPVAVALTIFVAVLSAFPLRRLASIRPASVFRGEA